MYDDVEGDFWKEILVELLKKNMARTDGTRFSMNDCQQAFENFQLIHPELKPEIVNSQSYITWEIFITPSIKLRLFVQNQVKVTLLQKQNGDLVKIADGKFPYNPFPEIKELLRNKDQILVQLNKVQNENLRIKKQQKLCFQFIKAHLLKKYKDTDIIWNLEENKNDFILHIQDNGKEKSIPLSRNNYLEEIKSLL